MNWDAKSFQLYIHQNSEVIVVKSIQTTWLNKESKREVRKSNYRKIEPERMLCL
jgi:hypothetical protein